MNKFVLILFYSITVVCVVILFCMNFRLEKNRQASTSPRMKRILIWNGAKRLEMATFGLGHEAFVRNNCPVRDCIISADSHDSVEDIVDQFDAILFNVPILFVELRLPNRRRTEQRYVFFSQESSSYNVEDLRKHVGFFNWTMSYQSYSDIPLSYGRIEPMATSQMDQYKSTVNVSTKTKLVAWFASHCDTQSRREVYVRDLQKFIKVDVYGWCGTLKCGWNESTGISDPHCYQMLGRDYKFYLSFENSMCNEYVTEKFYAALQHGVVPVVLGKADYSRLAPPHSYINALDYTPKELADYLRVLDANETLYSEYFQWKKDYAVISGIENMSREAFCLLCEKLHKDQKAKVYSEDLILLYSADTQCSHRIPWKLQDMPWA